MEHEDRNFVILGESERENNSIRFMENTLLELKSFSMCSGKNSVCICVFMPVCVCVCVSIIVYTA